MIDVIKISLKEVAALRDVEAEHKNYKVKPFWKEEGKLV